MIQVTGLSKRYARHVAVNDISFSVDKGDIVGFLGPNGAGKTTTMRILTCFMPPTEGSATVAGFDVFEQSFEVKKHIGYLPEAPPLYPEMSVYDYLTFVAPEECPERGNQEPHAAGDGTLFCYRCNFQPDLEALQGLSSASRFSAGNHTQS
jgi:ABC-2 type transport system ATP-binding protein